MKDFTVSLGKLSEFEKFYKFFSNSLRVQFPEYPKSAINQYLTESYAPKTLKKQLKNHKKFLFLAHDKNKEIIGYLLIAQTFGGISLAFWIAVDEKFQNIGIATSLVHLWEEFAKKNKSHALQIWTVERNRDFYKKRGFIEAGKLPNFWFGIDHYLFYRHV